MPHRSRPTLRPALERLEDRAVPSADFAWAFALASSTPGLTARESVDGVAADSAGNVLVKGYVNGPADFDPGPGATTLGPGSYLAKYTPAGALLWAQPTDISGLEDTITVDGADNSYIATRTSSTQYFITKYDPAGTLVRTYNLGSLDPYAVAVDAAGNVYVAANPWTIGGNGPTAYLVKFDGAAGSQTWSRQLVPANSSSAQVRDIGLDAAGNVYASGHFVGTVDFDPGAAKYNLTSFKGSGANGNGSNAFVLKLNAAGNFAWAGSMGTDDYRGTFGSNLNVDATGNVYLSGSWFPGSKKNDFDPGPATVALTSAGDRDIFVLKLDTNRTLQWARSIGSLAAANAEGDYPRSMALDAGGVYLTGRFYGTVDFDPGPGVANLTATPTSTSSDLFVLKLTTAGAYSWAVAAQGDQGDNGYDVTVTPAGEVYTVGSFGGITDFDPGAGAFSLTNLDYFPDPNAAHAPDGFVWKLTQSGSSPVAAKRTPANGDASSSRSSHLPAGRASAPEWLTAGNDEPGLRVPDLVATSLVLEQLMKRKA